jgi:hypothetical protein
MVAFPDINWGPALQQLYAMFPALLSLREREDGQGLTTGDEGHDNLLQSGLEALGSATMIKVERGGFQKRDDSQLEDLLSFARSQQSPQDGLSQKFPRDSTTSDPQAPLGPYFDIDLSWNTMPDIALGGAATFPIEL